MKLWKKTMLLAFCVAMTAAISSCDMISGMLGGGESETSSSVEAPASESTPATSEPDSESTSDSTSEEDVKVEYTVTFKQDGCEDIVRTVEKGKALADVPVPQEKAGYTVKWNITNFAKITKDTVVTAVATPNTYTVTYADADVAATTVTFDGAYELATPTKEGFKFLGWFVGEEEVPMTGTWTTANDVELTAKWQAIYTVTFVQNGCDNVVKTVLDGEALTDIPATQAKTGYTVVWETVDLSAVTGDMTVNAVETANTYTITFDMDGGTGAPATMEVTFDGEYALPAPTKTDYNFVAWVNGENSMANTGVWNIASDVALVASWVEKDKCVITFVQDGCADVTRTIILGNDLTDIPAPQAKTGYTVVWDTTDFTAIEGNMTVTAIVTPNDYTVTYVGADIAPATFTFDGAYELTAPEKEGFKFLGWFVGETEMPMTGTWTTANNVEVTAKWQAIYTVTFVQNGYDNIVKTVLDGEALTDVPAVQEKMGYTIVWDVTDFSAITGNMTVTAVETANKYTITYNANGGGDVEAQEVAFGAEYTLATPTYEGYEFIGWYIMNGDVITDTKLEAGVWATDGNVSVIAKWGVAAGEYAMKYNFNVTDAVVTQITRQAYPSGSTVSFKYFIPAGTTTGWWGIAWHTDPSLADNYHTAGINNAIGYKKLETETGVWTTAIFTLPDNGDGAYYYLYFGSEMDGSKWIVDGATSYALIDDFKIGGVYETFNNGIEASIFKSNVAGGIEIGAGYTAPAIEEGEYALKYMFNADGVSMITKQGYPGGSKVSFKYYIPADAIIADNNWWGVAWHNDPSKADMYHAAGIHDPVGRKSIKWVQGTWVDFEFTIEGDANTLYYLYFGSNVGNANGGWSMPDGSDAYVLFDDFTINGVTDNFNKHIDASIFEVLKPSKVLLSEKGEGFFVRPFEEGEYAMKYICNASGETVSQVTKKAYAGGSTVSFQYYIPEGTVTSWWGIGWSTSNTGLDIYDTANASKGYQPSAKTGEWVTVEFTLPEGGEYYLYFGSEVGKAHGRWMNGNENAYILIDNFKVSGEKTEDFNKPMEEWAFDVLFPGAVALSDKDAGIANTTPDLPAIEKPVAGEYGAKIQIDMISSTASTPSFITAQAYTFDKDTVVTFDYYMTGNTNNKWWTLSWTNDNKVADIYAHVGSNKENNDGKDLPREIQDVWATATVTVPAGTWYLYIGGAVGEWSGGSVIIDNVKFGDTLVEDFNDGTYGIFLDNRDSKPDAITMAAGKPTMAAGEYSAKLDFSKSFDNNAATFITKQAYAGGSTVSFKYMIPEETTVGDWWAICWDTNAASPNFWAVGNGPASPNGGINPNPNKVKGSNWVEFSFTLPNDDNMYYLYFTGYQNWAGYVYIDDFTVTAPSGVAVDNFNKGFEESLFNVNNAAYVTLGDGYTAPTVDPEPEPEPDPTPDPEPEQPDVPTPDPDAPATGENGAKIYFDKISSTTSTPSFITTNAYTFAEDTVVTFDYYMSGNTLNKWWTLSWTNDKSVADIYAHVGNNKENNDGRDLPTGVQDTWTTASITVPAGTWYIYFGGAKGEWSGGYVIIDNVKFGDELVADFNDGTYGIFEDNRDSEPDAITIAAGKVEEKVESAEYAMKYIFNASGETVSQVTKQAYAGGSTVSFKYYIPVGTATQWWGICWSTSNTGLDIYAAASTASAKPLSTVVGEWTTVEFTLPEGGEYYLYFGSEVGNWKFENGDNAYVLIDDFTVNGVKETFNNGMAESMFDVLVPGTVVEGDGYVPAPQAAKIMLNNVSGTKTTPSFITSKAYSGVATITFDCYITGNPDGKWWCLNWTADKANANIYAFNNNGNTSETANGRGLTTANQDTWQAVTIEIPEGEWYFFFGGEKGQWGDGYVILDNIVFKDADGNVIATENFDEGFIVFENNRASDISLVEGKTE